MKKLKTLPKDFVSRGRTPGVSKYDKFLDGGIYELTEQDILSVSRSLRNFRSRVHGLGKRQGLSVSVQKRVGGTYVVWVTKR